MDFIVEKVGERPGQVSLIALGPLTNIAQAFRQAPQIKAQLGELVVMGGAIRTHGNVTPHAEFNVFNDAIAAQEVLSSGVPLTLVSLDTCRQVVFTGEHTRSLRQGPPTARMLGRMIENWFRLHPDQPHYELCDPLAIAVTLEPGLLRRQARTVRVEARRGERHGQTRVLPGSGGVQVSVSVETERALDMCLRLLLRRTAIEELQEL